MVSAFDLSPYGQILIKNIIQLFPLGHDYMDRASPVNRAEKCHENLPWAAK
jgi:hypothetical protein